jgi:signal transduction histidine kinase
MTIALQEATFLGIAAAAATLVGAVLSVAGYIANRKSAAEKANEEQHKELLAAREEAERLSKELHDLRMKKDESQ